MNFNLYFVDVLLREKKINQFKVRRKGTILLFLKTQEYCCQIIARKCEKCEKLINEMVKLNMDVNIEKSKITIINAKEDNIMEEVTIFDYLESVIINNGKISWK